ncbi:hypothetical protein K432DRAFT_398354 [Lepidopterella palustris CBS 459.81]|uniref:Uncharacterized protein n=1 Tax=Lepidopterella palustris CBS 459.81 TaxID=1314670 RepID=A0A8E2DYR5_9PEZI|nr:hypothetical protein K432DRAFT_398354 [Lepidopterella palustris CBS 459.81]
MVSMSDPLLGLDGVREVVSSYFHMAPIVAEATVFGQRPNRPRCSCFLPEETPSRSVPSPKEYTSVPPRPTAKQKCPERKMGAPEDSPSNICVTIPEYGTALTLNQLAMTATDRQEAKTMLNFVGSTLVLAQAWVGRNLCTLSPSRALARRKCRRSVSFRVDMLPHVHVKDFAAGEISNLLAFEIGRSTSSAVSLLVKGLIDRVDQSAEGDADEEACAVS